MVYKVFLFHVKNEVEGARDGTMLVKWFFITVKRNNFWYSTAQQGDNRK
jgi:hypothetical protein